uniref:Uncharacterized protein n=1 Tax=Avena sativa TaxID=4498 RepID=A0ACD5WCX0_AVESA
MEARFFRFLRLVGVGFKARTEREGRELFLKLGFSHEVQFTAPPAVRVFCFKPNLICFAGIDKQRVYHFAGAVRTTKPPEVYKGKGLLYMDEQKYVSIIATGQRITTVKVTLVYNCFDNSNEKCPNSILVPSLI